MGQEHSRHSTTATRHCTSLLLAAALIFTALGANAQTGSDIEQWRTATRFNLGLGVVMGELDFRSNPVIVITDLGQIPSASIGLEAWINENAGFDTSYQFGTLGEVAVPLDVLLGEEATLEVTHHRFSGSFIYRWFTGPQITSWAIGARLGFQLHSIIPSPHTPTLILSTQYFGPELGLTARAPLTESLGLDLDALGVFPFNVREFPDKSGVPKTPIGVHLGVAPYLKVASTIYLKARYDLRFFNVGYEQEGTRGLGGVTGGASDDLFHSVLLQVEWVP